VESITDRENELEKPDTLFTEGEMGHKPKSANFEFDGGRIPERGLSKAPDQTNSKSRLIADYISKFQLVTKGGLYIDGFSAPQSRSHEDAWTARRVLEIDPPRLRTFWLCDIDPDGITQLKELKKQHHRNPQSRRVFVHEGDFNITVKQILKSPRFTRKAAIFALLDQRNTECHWATVQALAAREGRTKIELLYFLGTSWLHRSLTQSTRPERLLEIDRWWGGPNWRSLIELTQIATAKVMADRFGTELGYSFVNVYPIQQRVEEKKVAFYLIHASDHPDAPKLMSRSYRQIMGDIPGTPGDTQTSMKF